MGEQGVAARLPSSASAGIGRRRRRRQDQQDEGATGCRGSAPTGTLSLAPWPAPAGVFRAAVFGSPRHVFPADRRVAAALTEATNGTTRNGRICPKDAVTPKRVRLERAALSRTARVRASARRGRIARTRPCGRAQYAHERVAVHCDEAMLLRPRATQRSCRRNAHRDVRVVCSRRVGTRCPRRAAQRRLVAFGLTAARVKPNARGCGRSR